MRKLQNRILLWLAAIGVFAAPALVLAQFAAYNVDDIKPNSGLPNKVAASQGQKHIYHSHKKYLVEVRIREEHARLRRERELAYLARLKYQAKVIKTLQAQIAAGKKNHPVLVAHTVVEVPYENLVLNFATPKQTPVAGLHVVATVHPKAGPDVVFDNLVTDAQGRVKLSKIGPLPVGIDFAVAPAPNQGDEEPEWRLADVDAASLIVPHAMGTKVASYVNVPYQVASIAPVAYKRRGVVYEYEQPAPVVVERTIADLDVAAPAGSAVTCAALGDQPLTVPDTGHLLCHVPLSKLEDGPVPILVAAILPAGEAEAVIDNYTSDPYQANVVTSPPLQLVNITHVALTGSVGVMASTAQVVQTFGNLQKGKGKNGDVVSLTDGSQVWNYRQQGIAFKVRPSPFNEGRDNLGVVERIRLTSAQGGNIGGITVGSSAEDVAKALGNPESHTANTDGLDGTTDNYLDKGVRICETGGHVQWIEVARPTPLLTAGTTAFVQRQAARLFVENYEGNTHTVVPDMDSLKAYLAKLPSVRLVNSKDDADLVLNAHVTDFSDHKDQIIGGLPFKYSCTTRLTYSLYDPETDQYIVRDKEVASTASADYSKEALIGGGIAAVLLTRKNDWAKLAGALVAGGGIYELQKSVQRAANRCPGIAARTVFGSMVADLNRASDFSVRMTGIDYGQGRMYFNVGTAEGIHVSTPDAPCEFQVMVAGRPLPNQEGGNSADYYTAEVVEADEQSCACELHHVKRSVKRSSEKTDDQIDLDMVRRIPDPATGMVSALADVQFASLPVITDADIQAANAEADREAQEAEAKAAQENKSRSNSDSNSSTQNANGSAGNALGSLLGKVFGRHSNAGSTNGTSK